MLPIRERMIEDMVNEVHCWNREGIIKKAQEIYRSELKELPLSDLMSKYNNLTWYVMNDGSPMP